MANHEGNIKGFHHLSEAWYGPNYIEHCANKQLVDEVNIGFYGEGDEAGGTSGEFAIRWEQLRGPHDVSLKLCAWNDAWSALVEMPELIALLGTLDSTRISPKEFCERLIALGYKDLTAREQR